ILNLQQSGSVITGTFKQMGYSIPVTGNIAGTHFELFRTSGTGGKKRLIVGDVVGSNLHVVGNGITWGTGVLVATPATVADDDIPTAPYLAPPPLHKVPSNGLAKTPPMGWNHYNSIPVDFNDAAAREMADVMVSSGMRDAGYTYLILDDSWEGVRDAHGVLQPNHKFPDLKALADYIHSKGLKLGIYSSPGPATCDDYPGSYGHEELDAKTWAAWGVDYLKYDWCSAGIIYRDKDLQAIYQKMGDALEASGRPIVYGLCEYGWEDVQEWGPDVGANLWRTTGDIHDNWKSVSTNGFGQSSLAPYAGPGHWNDPDMLEVGNGHLSSDEDRSHMSLWSLLAAPLIAGNDIRSMTPATKDILLNKEVIAVDQDPLGKEAAKLSVNGDLETWTRPLADGSVAVGVFNLGSVASSATIKVSDLKLGGNVKARNLWTHEDLSPKEGRFTASVPAHGVFMLRVSTAR
ncbi:MAG: glycoside hydrolase family 27 protein, partial [Silvibacterium sp.]